jgi:hypothetical protein
LATGSCFAFSKFRPFSGVPAGTLLLTSGAAFFSATLAAVFSRAGLGVGVRGALKGCAAEVEVAAGESLGWRGVDCAAAEMGVALREGRVVERKRRVGRAREARRQVRQIIACVVGVCGWGGAAVLEMELLEMRAEKRSWRRGCATVSVRVPTVFACRRINNLDHLYKMRLFNHQK